MTGASRRVGVCRTAGNRNYLTAWGRLGWRLGGGRGGCDTRCSPRLAIRDAGLQWGNERELRESVANHEVEVVCVAAGASESSFAGLLGWRGGFRLCWVNRGIGPVVLFSENGLGQLARQRALMFQLPLEWEISRQLKHLGHVVKLRCRKAGIELEKRRG